MTEERMQIGEVAERVGLSLRTIRYYEEVGLVVPSARSAGGFRLYTEADVQRLLLIKRMKPLDFSLGEMRELIEILDQLASDEVTGAARAAARERLTMYRTAVLSRCEVLRERLQVAEGFADQLRRELSRRPRSGSGSAGARRVRS